MNHASDPSNRSAESLAPADFIANVGDCISARGLQERRWFESWQSDSEDAARNGDEDACELLLDVLVAFDAFQADKHPARLHRVA